MHEKAHAAMPDLLGPIKRDERRLPQRTSIASMQTYPQAVTLIKSVQESACALLASAQRSAAGHHRDMPLAY